MEKLSLRTLDVQEMEEIEAGSGSAACVAGIAGCLVFGMGGVIAAAGGPVSGIAFAMASNYFGWGMTAWACS
jgi:hypothetical protein